MSELQKSENTTDFVSIKTEDFLDLVARSSKHEIEIKKLRSENQEQEERLETIENELTILKRLYFEKQQPIKKEIMNPDTKFKATDEKVNPYKPKNYAELKNLQQERGYLSTSQVIEIFHICKRTLQNYRDEGLINYYTVGKGKKIWYKIEELEATFKQKN
ncbi:MAG: helix-turn-helix domain-containing protein [Bacteroidetes bacterium]|nr:helix-turn-helix domain-containing protein [Bacteroidota bacterium]